MPENYFRETYRSIRHQIRAEKIKKKRLEETVYKASPTGDRLRFLDGNLILSEL